MALRSHEMSNWKRIDEALRYVPKSFHVDHGNLEEALQEQGRHFRDLRRLAMELRDRLWRKELELEDCQADLRAAEAQLTGKAKGALEDLEGLQRQVERLEAEGRQSDRTMGAKAQTIANLVSDNRLLQDALQERAIEVAQLTASLKDSKKTHLADIRAARETCTVQAERLSRAEAEAERLRGELEHAYATADEMKERLGQHGRLNVGMAREIEALRTSVGSVESTRRMYEDAKFDAERFRREAGALTRMLSDCEGSPPRVRAAAGKNKKSRKAKGAGNKLQRAAAVRKLRREWEACPGGLAYLGEDHLGERMRALVRTVRTGGGFVNVIDVREEGVYIKQGGDWMPAHAIDVISSFRKSFCPQVEWAAFEVLALVLNRVWRAREEQRVGQLQARHLEQVKELERQLNHADPMLVVHQSNRIAALKRQLQLARRPSPVRVKAGGGGAGGKVISGHKVAIKRSGAIAAVTMEKNMALSRKVDDLSLENVKLREIIQKAASAVQNVAAIHRDGAEAQSRQAARCLSKAAGKIRGLLDEAEEAITNMLSYDQGNEEVAELARREMERLAEAAERVLQDCGREAGHYAPPVVDWGLPDPEKYDSLLLSAAAEVGRQRK